MTPNVLIAALIVLCATGLAVVLAMREHVASPAIIFVLGILCATGVTSGTDRPIFSSSIQITKTTASEAEKDNP